MQTDIFEYLYPSYKFDKPIRLIELFAGIGSQAKALERLGVNFEHYKVVEFDKYAIKSYNAIHGTNFETSDITQIHASDVYISDSDIYTYILTYSFPCQDLSIAGKGKGMSKGSGTRSGLLWEVERILDECKELPQVLLMENVPQVHGKNNIEHFKKWIDFLETKGYRNHWQDLNAKCYGIPQNRNRCFMISILGDYKYEFPHPFELKLRLKDVLEDEVDEKYYLSNEKIKKIQNSSFQQEKTMIQKSDVYQTLLARDYKDPKCVEVEKTKIDVAINLYDIGIKGFNRATGDVLNTNGLCKTIDTMQWGNRQPKILVPEATKKGYALAKEGDGVYINRPHQKRGCVQKDMIQTLKTSCSDVGVVTKNTRIRKLTPLECWRLMGFDDEDFYKAEKVNSNTQLYKQAGNSIVVNVLEAIFKMMVGDDND